MQNVQRLDNVRIRRFKGLADVELSHLGGFNIFFGANDVGKTSALEAIFLVTGCANAGLPIRLHNNRDYVVQSFDDLSNFFYHLDVESPIELTADSTSPDERRCLKISAHTPNATPEFSHRQIERTSDAFDAQHPDGTTHPRLASTVALVPRALRYEATLDDSSGQVSFAGDIIIRSAKDIDVPSQPEVAHRMVIPARIIMPGLVYDSKVISDLIVNKRDREFLETLRVINPEIQSIAVNGDIAFLDVGLDRMVPLNMFGGGMIRAAGILPHCILGNDRILLIDEIENGFHHTTLRPLLEALLALSVQRGVQIFATSHSIEILKYLQEILRDDKYAHLRSSTISFTLEKDQQGLARCYRYEFSEFDHCITNEIEMR